MNSLNHSMTEALTQLDDPSGDTSEELLAIVTRRLVRLIKPERIYLFGSRARGDYRPESDYDFMIIVPDSTSDEEKSRLWELAHDCTHKLPLTKDIAVWTRTFFNRQLHLKASISTAVMRDGRLLYVKPECLYTQDIQENTVCETPVPPDDPVLIFNTADWFERVRKDLRCAEIELTSGEPDTLEDVMFHAQQAVEKAMKGYLTWHDQPFPKTHELRTLSRMCAQLDRSLRPALSRVIRLSKWSLAGRYLGESSTTQPRAELAFNRARDFTSEILRRLPPAIAPHKFATPKEQPSRQL